MGASEAVLRIDGSEGEGGGQILRSALALSLVTGRSVTMTGIRAKQARPGLLRQHLTAVDAACQVGRAQAEGATIGSSQLTFAPGLVQPGEYRFAVGTAGSATLVLQTVLPALVLARGPSRLVLEGGTHNPFAPPFDFLARAFLPVLGRMGAKVEARLERHGFYPAGGGRFTVEVEPVQCLERLDLLERGPVRRVWGRALVANLPESIGTREMRVLRTALALPREATRTETVDSYGPGNVVLVVIEADNVTEVMTGFGEKGTSAEMVAETVAREAREYLDAGVPVGRHLADQLLLPMALAGGGSFRTLEPTGHTRTNAEVVSRFLGVRVSETEEADNVWSVEIVA